MIQQQPRLGNAPEIKLGRTLKNTTIEGLDSLEQGVGLVGDILITARAMVELVHASLQEPIAAQRADYAATLQTSINQLEGMGMTTADAHRHLQLPYTAVPAAS